MPSLATRSEPVMATDPAEFSKSMVVMMEKKIRNLEKRKGKLEDYRAKQSLGQTLTEEQLKAVAKLDDVLSQIELLQDLTKQFNTYATDVVKQQKKQQKRERFEQIENERKRFLNVLHLQNVLTALGVDVTRQAFVDGTGGAIKLEEQELNHLDELYKIINPERGTHESLTDQLKTASEHLQFVLDGRDKGVCGTTYRQLNDLITKIQTCPFFTERAKSPEIKEATDNTDTATEDGYVHIHPEEVPHADSVEVQSSLPPEVLPEQPDVNQAEQMYQQQNPMPSQPAVDPTKSFEKIVENVQGQFNFIQDSEIDIDSPHVDPAVLSVRQMPAQPYQPQTMINHNQPQPENSAFLQAQAADASYQQYNIQSNVTGAPQPPPIQSNVTGAPQPIQMPSEPAAPSTNQSMFSSQPELNFETGMTFESSAYKQHDKQAHNDDFQQRNQGQMRRGGYRGGRGSHTNGYGGRGGYRSGASDRSGGSYRGDRPAGGDRGRQHSPSGNNGFPSEQRRGSRGGSRGGSGFRGGAGRGTRGGNRGGYRGAQQQQQQQQ